MDAPEPKRRPFLTPTWLIFGLLVVEGLLWLSERYTWLGFNEKKGWTVLIAVAVVGVVMLVMLLWFIASLLFRWRLQFSIRSMLVLTVAVAVPCSWLAVEMKKAREQHDAVEEIGDSAGWVGYDFEEDSAPTLAEPRGPAWLRNLLGGDFFNNVVDAGLDGPDTDAQMKHLKGLPQLHKLDLGGPQITDAGLKHLAGLTHLQVLGLDHDTQISDAGWQCLGGLNQLQELRVGPRLTDAGLKHLAGLTQLQVLVLDDTQISDVGLQRLGGLNQLQELRVCGTIVTGAGLKHLTGLSQLRKLDLSYSQVTDAGLEHAEGLKQLEELDIGDTRVTDAGLQHLKGLNHLSVLGLSCTQVTDSGLVQLAGLTQLQRLYLDKTKITDAGLAHLAGLTRLSGLWLEHNPQITDAGVKRLQQALPNCIIKR